MDRVHEISWQPQQQLKSSRDAMTPRKQRILVSATCDSSAQATDLWSISGEKTPSPFEVFFTKYLVRGGGGQGGPTLDEEMDPNGYKIL